MFIYIIIFCLIVVGDIAIYIYDCKFKILNLFIVTIMLIGHPLYFAVSVIIIYLLNLLYQGSNISLSGILLIIVFMILFGFIRYLVYQKLFDKNIKLCAFSKFYFFTLFCIPFYVFISNGEMGFAILFQVFLPICIGIVLFYSLLKILIIKLIQRRKNI